MSALEVFTYASESEIRALTIDGEAWFVAKDLCDVLGIANVGNVLSRLDDDEQSSIRLTDGTPGNPNRAIVNEPGLYSLILRSEKPEAKAFKRWITHEVIPSIRKSGSYGTPATMSFEEMTAHVIHGLTAKIAELESPAAAWESLSNADGDWTVSESAKILSRDGIQTGPRKLFDWLQANKWLFRRGGRWVAMQSAVNAGLLTERITSGYFDQRTGERKQADPQVRITAKGIERLRSEMHGHLQLVQSEGVS